MERDTKEIACWRGRHAAFKVTETRARPVSRGGTSGTGLEEVASDKDSFFKASPKHRSSVEVSGEETEAQRGHTGSQGHPGLQAVRSDDCP